MSFDDWILAFHVLSAFAFVGALVLLWVVVMAVRRAESPGETVRLEPMVKIGNGAVAVGAGGTLVFGIWLAFSVGGYDIWDPWIVAALVLWGVAGWSGQRTDLAYRQGMAKAKELLAGGETGTSAELAALNRTRGGLVMQAATTLILLLLLVDMIWKPGA